jgi:hypothetical protein
VAKKKKVYYLETSQQGENHSNFKGSRTFVQAAFVLTAFVLTTYVQTAFVLATFINATFGQTILFCSN